MQMEMDKPLHHTRSIDAALERLRQDLFDTPAAAEEDEGPEPIDYTSLEFEVERMRKRLAIWEIFMGYMRQGAHSWPEVQRSLTKEDFEKIVAICDGVPLPRSPARRAVGGTARGLRSRRRCLAQRLCRSWRRPGTDDLPEARVGAWPSGSAALGDGQAPLSTRACTP